MHPSSDLTQVTAVPGFPRVGASVIALALACWGVAILARATPDIIRHIARPCGGCYVSAFGPPLEPYNLLIKPGGPTAATSASSPAAMPAASIDNRDLLRFTLNELIAFDRPPGVDASLVPRNFGTLLAVNVGAMTWAFHAAGDESALTLERLEPRAEDPRDQPEVNGAVSWDFAGSVPYWHLAVQKDLQRHFLQIGAYGSHDDGTGPGLSARGMRTPGVGALAMRALDMRKGAISSAGQPPATTADVAGTGIGGRRGFIADPGDAISDVLSAEVGLPHDARVYDARYLAAGTAGLARHDTFFAATTWSFAGSVTSTIQYFRIAGSMNTLGYFFPGSFRNSAGVVAGVSYVPWLGANSPVQFLNLRVAAQYVAFTEFNGAARGAASNNGLFLTLWGALRF